MSIVGFNFKKILVEKKKDVKGKVNINNNVSITDIKETTLSLGTTKQPAIRISFDFKTIYEPNLGNISLEGELVFIGTDKLIKDTLKDWNDKKKMPDAIASSILGTVLEKCNIQALVMSRDINLPSPIPLPKVRKGPVPKTN